MAGTGIMAGICTSPYPSPYPTEKVGDSPYPYPYPYPVNAGIPVKTGTGSDNTHGTSLFAISKHKKPKIDIDIDKDKQKQTNHSFYKYIIEVAFKLPSHCFTSTQVTNGYFKVIFSVTLFICFVVGH